MTGDAETGRRVSVVIPARNEEAAIEWALDSLAAQTRLPDEVILVDGRSTDATRDRAGSAAHRLGLPLQIVDNPDRTIPHALNRGLAQASGDIIVRLDAHAAFNPEYIETAVDLLRDERWSGVGGRKIAIGSTAFGRSAALAFTRRVGSGGSAYHGESATREVEHVPFGVYRRSVAVDRGGWDERCLVNQDFEFDHRLRAAGGRLLYDPRLQISWRGRNTFGSLAYQYYRYGIGKAFVLRLHPDSARTRQLVPSVLVIALAASVLLFRRHPMAALATPAAYSSLLAMDGLAARSSRQADTPTALRLPLAYLAMHLSWGVGLLVGLCRRGRDDPFRQNPDAG